MTLRNAFADMATEASASDGATLLRRIVALLTSPRGYDRSLSRYRQTAIVESGTVTTVSTVTTLANISNIDGRNASMLLTASGRASWALNVRARIT